MQAQEDIQERQQEQQQTLPALFLPRSFFAGAMALGANLAAVRIRRMGLGQAVLDATAKGAAAVLIARAATGRNALSPASNLAMLLAAGYAIGSFSVLSFHTLGLSEAPGATGIQDADESSGIRCGKAAANTARISASTGTTAVTTPASITPASDSPR